MRLYNIPYMKTTVLFFSLINFSAIKAQQDTTINVYFDNNVFVLTAQQQTDLAAYKANTVCVISFKGYADTVGATHNNKILAQKRVDNVAAVFSDVANCNTDNQTAAGETTGFGADLQENRKVEIKLKLKPTTVTTNEVVKRINNFNIRFLPDRAEIDPASEPYLDQLFTELSTYNNARFEIVGHINLQGKKITSPNDRFYKLSQQRAKLIAQLLQAKGIAADRLQHKGVGNSEPLHVKPANQQEQRENMRVEIKILQ